MPTFHRRSSISSHSVLPIVVGLAAFLALLPGIACAQLFLNDNFPVQVTKDIVYEPGAGLLLDLYAPSGPNVPALKPGLVLVHGGGWATGSKDAPPFENETPMTEYAQEFAKRGYVCACINYRLYGNPALAPTHQLDGLNIQLITDAVNTLFGSSVPVSTVQVLIESAIQDTTTAIDWLRAQADSLGVDPGRIAVAGYSAGAFNALFASYLGNGPQKVRAVWSNAGSFGGGGNDAQVLGAASGVVPVIAFHGDSDQVLPYPTFAAPLDAALDSLDVPHSFHTLPGEDHYFTKDFLITQAASRGVPGTVEELIADFFFAHLGLSELQPPPPQPMPLAWTPALVAVAAGFIVALRRPRIRR